MVSGINLYKSKTVEETLYVRITRDFDPSKTSSIFLDRDWFSKNTMFISDYGIPLTLTGKFKRISESETVYTVDNKQLPNIILQAGHRLEYVGMSVLDKEQATTYSLTVVDNTRSSQLVHTVEDLPDTRNKKIEDTLTVTRNFSLKQFDSLLYVNRPCVDGSYIFKNRNNQIVVLGGHINIEGKIAHTVDCINSDEDFVAYPGEELIMVEPEPLYSEEDLVPSQFFGLNDYLKCEI